MSPPALDLRISGLSGTCCRVRAEGTWTVGDVKRAIEDELRIPACEQRLLLGLVELRGGEQLASRCGGAAAPGTCAAVDGREPVDLTLVRRPQEHCRWLQRVAADHRLLRSAPEPIRADKEIVLAAVRQNGCTLEHAAEELRGDSELVLEAVQRGAFALTYAAEALRRDRAFVSAVVQRNGFALRYVAAELQLDREIVLKAVHDEGAAFEYAAQELKMDPDFVLEAAHENRAALPFAAQELWADGHFVLAAARLSAEIAFDHSAEELWAESAFALGAIEIDACAFEYVHEELVQSHDFLLDAVEHNQKVVNYMTTLKTMMPALARFRVEIADVAATVSHLLLNAPPCQKMCNFTRVTRVVDERHFELAVTEQPIQGPSDFWPSGCTLTATQQVDLFWKFMRGHNCKEAVSCLAAVLQGLCAKGIQLVHSDLPVRNVLALNCRRVGVADLLPGQLFFECPELGTKTYVPATISCRRPPSGDTRRADGGEPRQADGDSGAYVLTEGGEVAPHWWLAAVVGSDAGDPAMLHLDVCGPAYDVFEYSPVVGEAPGKPQAKAPLHTFYTPEYGYDFCPSLDDRLRFKLHHGKGAPAGLRYLQCLREPLGPTVVEVTPLRELLTKQHRVLGAHIHELITNVCTRFMLRMPCGVGVQVADLDTRPELSGKVGRVLEPLDGRGLCGRVPVCIGSEEPVMLDPLHLKIFPAPHMAQFLSFEDMAARLPGVSKWFDPGQHVTVVGLADAAHLNGKSGQVLHYNFTTKHYEVLLLSDNSPLPIPPWNLDIAYRDTDAMQEVFGSPHPAVRQVVAMLRKSADVPFECYGEPAVVWAMRRLVHAGMWSGREALEKRIADTCALAEHPSAPRALQILREREETDAAAAVPVQSLEEVRGDPGLREVFGKLEALQQPLPRPHVLVRNSLLKQAGTCSD